jgi:peptide chain release factor 1
LFAGELARSYMMFAESEGYKVEISEETPSEAGGYKEIMFEVKGE